MKINLILILLLLGMPLALANTIEDTLITIKIYNISEIPKNNTLFNSSIIIKVEVINNEYSGNNQNFTFTIFNNTVVNEDKNFNLIFIKNESVSQTIVEQYATCLNDKSKCENDLTKWDLGWDLCKRDLKEAIGENSTKCNDELNACNFQVKEKNLELQSKNTEITTLNTEKKDTKNTRWFYGIIGVVLGIVGCLFKEGKLGQGPKDKAMDEFNRGQAG